MWKMWENIKCDNVHGIVHGRIDGPKIWVANDLLV
jgi:hypothetical protein